MMEGMVFQHQNINMSLEQIKDAPAVPPLVKGKPTDSQPKTNKSPQASTQAIKQSQSAGTKKEANKPQTSRARDQPKPQQDSAHGKSRSHSRSRSRDKGKKQDRGDRGGKNDKDRDRDRDRDRNRRKDYGRNDDAVKSSTYFKTKLCPVFLSVKKGLTQQGKCHKETKCTFAHGQHQLRDMPNFKKTKLCIEYSHGKCPYSSKECKYAHGQSELKRHLAPQTKQDYEAVMNKYRINTTYDSYSHGGSFGSSVGYSHPPAGPALSGPPLYPSSGYPGPMPSSHLPPMGDWKMPNPYESRSSNPSWSYAGGPWMPPRAPDMGSGSVPAGNYPSFEAMGAMSSAPGPVPAPFRSWDYGTGPAVASTRAEPISGSSGSSFSGSVAVSGYGSSSGNGFSGSGPSHYASSNPYSSSSGAQFTGSTGSSPFMSMPSYHTGSAPSSSFDPFSIGMGQTMPRRVPPPPPER